MKPLEIDKITAARNLFNDATLLFYERRSAIAIHHLAHAAHEVLHALTGSSDILNTANLTPHGLREFKRGFNISKNFIKHADKDPHATLLFNSVINIYILFDCAYMITLNIDKNCIYSQTIIAWCAFVHPELFKQEFIGTIHKSVTVTFDLQDFGAIAEDLKLHYKSV